MKSVSSRDARSLTKKQLFLKVRELPPPPILGRSNPFLQKMEFFEKNPRAENIFTRTKISFCYFVNDTVVKNNMKVLFCQINFYSNWNCIKKIKILQNLFQLDITKLHHICSRGKKQSIFVFHFLEYKSFFLLNIYNKIMYCDQKIETFFIENKLISLPMRLL